MCAESFKHFLFSVRVDVCVCVYVWNFEAKYLRN